jgi:hypothetical protein
MGNDCITFYDRSGHAIAYLADDGSSIFTYPGAAVAYLVDDGIFDYRGTFLGWFIDGWVIDRSGDRVFFTHNAPGGPVKPVRSVRPVRGVKSVKPVKGVKQLRPVRPVRSLSWSDLSADQFFQ